MADERDWDLEREPDPAAPGPGTTRLIGDLAPLLDIETEARQVDAASIDLDELRPDELELLHELQQPSASTPDPDVLIDLTGQAFDPPAHEPPDLGPRSGSGEHVADPREALRLGTSSSEPDPLNPVFQEPRPLR